MTENKSFNVAIISDTHEDFYIPAKLSGDKLDKAMDKFIDEELWLKNADILIIAGDTSHYNNQTKLMLEKIAAKNIYKKIFITYGNHNLYLISNSQRKKFKTSWNKIEDLKSICEEIDTVEFLDGNIVEVDGIRIGGASGWYDFSYAKKNFGKTDEEMMHLWKAKMNDAVNIYGTDRPKWINDDSYELYAGNGGYGKVKLHTFDPLKFFESEKKKIEKIVDQCDIFVTHFGPFAPTLKLEYQVPLSGFYFFDGEEFLMNDKAPKLYIFGHTHDNYFFKHNNTWLACNPLGYKSENKNHEVEVLDLFNLDL